MLTTWQALLTLRAVNRALNWAERRLTHPKHEWDWSTLQRHVAEYATIKRVFEDHRILARLRGISGAVFLRRDFLDSLAHRRYM